MSKTRVFIYGSCVSRDTFEHLDPEQFELVEYVARQSVLSATTRPVEMLPPPTLDSRFQQRMVNGDFTSNLRPLLTQRAGEIDVLLVDLTDERLGVYLLPDGTVVTRTVELIESGAEQSLPQGAHHVAFGTQQHFEYWSGAVRALGDAIRNTQPQIAVAILDIPWADWSESGQQTPESFGIGAAQANPVFRSYVEVAVQALGAHVVTLDPSEVMSSSHHPWGDAPFHYAESVYLRAVRQLTGTEGRVVWGPTSTSTGPVSSPASGTRTTLTTHRSPDLAATVVVSNDNDAYALGTCLESLLGQSIGVENIEVLVVDNGSTDETQQVLDQFRHHFPPDLLRTIPQERASSTATGRNAAIEEARGAYIYFVNATDHLGTGALQAMTYRAHTKSSDIVIGKLVGIGRGAPRQMFKVSRDNATLKNFRVTDVLHSHCLYSTTFLREKKIRFNASLHASIDQPFAMSAYSRTQNIAIEADTDCYFLVRHKNAPVKPSPVKPSGPASTPFATMWATFKAVSNASTPRDRKRALKAQYWNRLLTKDLVSEFNKKKSPSARSTFLAEVNRLIGAHNPEPYVKSLDIRARVFLYLAQTGQPDALDAFFELTGEDDDARTTKAAAQK
jgi:hypothetical protein